MFCVLCFVIVVGGIFEIWLSLSPSLFYHYYCQDKHRLPFMYQFTSKVVQCFFISLHSFRGILFIHCCYHDQCYLLFLALSMSFFLFFCCCYCRYYHYVVIIINIIVSSPLTLFDGLLCPLCLLLLSFLSLYCYCHQQYHSLSSHNCVASLSSFTSIHSSLFCYSHYHFYYII